MKLYLIRHAWAEERDVDRFPDDRLRPLKPGSAKRFKRLLTTLGAETWPIETIFTSPLTRCVETARLLQDVLKEKVAFEKDEMLAPGSDWDSLLKKTIKEKISAAAWVGHGPDIDAAFALLLGIEQVRTKMSKGAIAAFKLSDRASTPKAKLLWYVDAKLLNL
jgi:phosphohistidine phosphatase SixA